MPTLYKGYTLPEYKDKGWSEIVLTLFRDTIDTIHETDQFTQEFNAAIQQTFDNLTSNDFQGLLDELDELFGDYSDFKTTFLAAFQQTLSNINPSDLSALVRNVDSLAGENEQFTNDFYNVFQQSFNNLSATNFSELLTELDNLFSPNVNLFNDYAVVDVYENEEGTLIYAGYQDENDNWLLKKVTIVGDTTTVRYATKVHAPVPPISTYTYSQAWSNRETVTFFDIVSLYNQ